MARGGRFHKPLTEVLRNLEAKIDAGRQRTGPGVYQSTSAAGTSLSFDEVGGAIEGIVTETINARSGTSPNFTFGRGKAQILRTYHDGIDKKTSLTSRIITVYNKLETPVLAGPKPVTFIPDDAGDYIAALGDCPA